jgi:hypothetical protein
MTDTRRKAPNVARRIVKEKPTYQRVGEIAHLVHSFRDFWKEAKRLSPNRTRAQILEQFGLSILPQTFNPFPNQLTSWEKKWGYEMERDHSKPTFSADGVPVIRTDESLMMGATLGSKSKRLADVLMDDALRMLNEDEDEYSAETNIKRKDHAMKVMAHVWKLDQKDQELALKRNADKRESAGFLMNLVRKATAGKLTENELELMRGSFITDGSTK